MQTWPDYWISEKRMDEDGDRIESVDVRGATGGSVGPARVWTRDTVVSAIEQGKTFMTITKDESNKWKTGATVHVVEVDGEKFIRTDRNNTPKDNLGNLPDF